MYTDYFQKSKNHLGYHLMKKHSFKINISLQIVYAITSMYKVCASYLKFTLYYIEYLPQEKL